MLSGLQSKMKYSQEDGFVCLVAERVPPLRSLFGVGGGSGGASSSSSKRTKSSDKDDDDDDDDLSALDEFSSSSSSDSDSLPPIAGVVEVSLQGEKRELEALWGVTGLMGVNSNDDESASGETTKGAGGGGLIKGLFGGWSSSSSPPLSDSASATLGGGFDESYAYVACSVRGQLGNVISPPQQHPHLRL